MSGSRINLERKVPVLRFTPRAPITPAQAQRLLRELDQLALLLDEVKRQTERVEAAADAIGDALIRQLDAVSTKAGRGKSAMRAGAKANTRARVLHPFPESLSSPDLNRAQG